MSMHRFAGFGHRLTCHYSSNRHLSLFFAKRCSALPPTSRSEVNSIWTTSAAMAQDVSAFIEKVDHCNSAAKFADWSTFLPFYIDNQLAGYISKSFAAEIKAYGSVFKVHDVAEQERKKGCQEAITLDPSLETPEQRTEAIAGVLETLRGQGKIRGWRNEMYPVVTSFHAAPLCLLERAAAVYFGIKAYGVHVNGYVETEEGKKLWVARRSASKPTWPGKLDHIVAGGQPHGLSCQENVIKECQEEASIPLELAWTAVSAGAVSYEALQKDGIKSDVLFVYDLLLPSSFVPQPQDGEVEDFRLMGMEDVAQLIQNTDDFKDNCNLVIIDFFVRHGIITPELPGYLDLVSRLRGANCS